MNTDKITIFEITDYKSVDQTGEVYRDGEGYRCSECCNVWKKDTVNPRWKYCPGCGNKITD